MPRPLNPILLASRIRYLNASRLEEYDVDSLIARRLREIREHLRRAERHLAAARREAVEVQP